MRIVMISTKEAALSGGSEVRNYYLYNNLKKYFTIKYIYIKPPEKSSPIKRGLRLLYGEIPYINNLKNQQLTATGLQDVRDADIICLQSLDAYFVFEKYIKYVKDKIIILDTHNVDYYRFLGVIQTKKRFEKIFGNIVAKKIKKLEIRSLKYIDYVLTCSEIDKKYFDTYFNPKRVLVVPNGVDVSSYTHKMKVEKNIVLFMSLLSYPPNNDAIYYYISKIHPYIKAQYKDYQLHIIGKNPSKWLKQYVLSDNQILLKGFVDDVKDELYKAQVCICPIRYGSGTRLKILEYMAAYKPIVSTTIGSEGINVSNGKNILLANSDQDFINAMIRLFDNEAIRENIGGNARILVENQYDWTIIITKFAQIIPALTKKNNI